ncbi:ABC transporter G family member 2 [Rhynchospora pubera]|uniref:ABC transporter G family member 2 n=1 Tax=Rhynchospora pubera TaxID=906938 RepID=A0AAV8H873_9POAL|nr:ABC transporter G family member 2 [Rhynchospora pubera]
MEEINQDNTTATNCTPARSDEPLVLSFIDLTYHVKLAKKRQLITCFRYRSDSSESGPTTMDSTKTILDSVSGEAREGEILAILGPSGSGKSTLIDALANRIARKSLDGLISLNGEKIDIEEKLKAISAYVMQDDLLYPMLTVQETLMFSAELRLPQSVSRSKKRERVSKLIELLGLGLVASAIVGDEGKRGISGGERRRVSIGVDIVHDPTILFLDEPTSGLDSTSAFMVVKVLQDIARRRSIVIMSIHQPSSRILGLLDHVLFLCKGTTVFDGPPASLPLFFSEFGRSIPEDQNRAEFVLDLIHELQSVPDGIKPLIEFKNSWLERRNAFHNGTSKSAHKRLLKDVIAAGCSHEKLNSYEYQKFANPWWAEVWILTRRSSVNTLRTPQLFLTQLGAVVLTGFIMGTLFWRLDGSPKGVVERVAFFTVAVSTMFYICAESLPTFLEERYIFIRETAHNMYRQSSYVISRTISSFPPLIVLSLTFALITFFAVGLAGGFPGLLFFMATILASFWAGSGFALFLSSILSHIVLGYAVVVAFLRFFVIFSGFFINRDRIPHYWIWFHYLSLVKYPYEAAMQNEFSDPNKCFVRGVQMFDNTPVEPYPYQTKVNLLTNISRSLRMNLTSTTCITTGPALLKWDAVTDLSKWNCLWTLVAWGFFFRFMFYIFLLAGSKNKRK